MFNNCRTYFLCSLNLKSYNKVPTAPIRKLCDNLESSFRNYLSKLQLPTEPQPIEIVPQNTENSEAPTKLCLKLNFNLGGEMSVKPIERMPENETQNMQIQQNIKNEENKLGEETQNPREMWNKVTIKLLRKLMKRGDLMPDNEFSFDRARNLIEKDDPESVRIYLEPIFSRLSNAKKVMKRWKKNWRILYPTSENPVLKSSDTPIENPTTKVKILAPLSSMPTNASTSDLLNSNLIKIPVKQEENFQVPLPPIKFIQPSPENIKPPESPIPPISEETKYAKISESPMQPQNNMIKIKFSEEDLKKAAEIKSEPLEEENEQEQEIPDENVEIETKVVLTNLPLLKAMAADKQPARPSKFVKKIAPMSIKFDLNSMNKITAVVEAAKTIPIDEKKVEQYFLDTEYPADEELRRKTKEYIEKSWDELSAELKIKGIYSEFKQEYQPQNDKNIEKTSKNQEIHSFEKIEIDRSEFSENARDFGNFEINLA